MNVKSEFIDNPKSSILLEELKNIDKALSNLIESVSAKCEMIEVDMTREENVKKTLGKLEDLEAPEELIEQYSSAIKDMQVKSKDEKLYHDLNSRIEKESKLVVKALEDDIMFIRGSISINAYIRSVHLKDLDYSVLKVPGIQYNRAKRESFEPTYVFHNQKIAVINVKKRRLSIKRNVSYQNAAEVFEERRLEAEKNTLLTNQTNRFQTPYLVSPRFKNIRFLWFSKDLPAFQGTKDGVVRLIW
jgi:energy-converting hydrogenase Eha subunit A